MLSKKHTIILSFFASIISSILAWLLLAGKPLYNEPLLIIALFSGVFILFNTALLLSLKGKEAKRGILFGYVFIVIPLLVSFFVIALVSALGNVGKGI